MERGELREYVSIRKFILSGKSVFTIQNEKTGNRFTYKVVQKETRTGNTVHFVNLLRGPDNMGDYIYLGMIRGGEFVKTQKTGPSVNSTSFKAFEWFWYNLHHMDRFPQIKFYHEGRCGRCGRRLTVPESIRSGFGPECINKV